MPRVQSLIRYLLYSNLPVRWCTVFASFFFPHIHKRGEHMLLRYSGLSSGVSFSGTNVDCFVIFSSCMISGAGVFIIIPHYRTWTHECTRRVVKGYAETENLLLYLCVFRLCVGTTPVFFSARLVCGKEKVSHMLERSTVSSDFWQQGEDIHVHRGKRNILVKNQETGKREQQRRNRKTERKKSIRKNGNTKKENKQRGKKGNWRKQKERNTMGLQ